MSCALLHLYAVYLSVSSPLFSPVDPGTDVAPEDCYTDDPSFAAELPGKQTPLIISISPISFSPVLALEFPTVVRKLLF